MPRKLSIDLRRSKNNGKVTVVLRGTLDGSGAYEAENVLKSLNSMIKRLERFSIGILSKAIKGCRRRFREVRLVGLGQSTLDHFRCCGVDSIHSGPGFANG